MGRQFKRLYPYLGRHWRALAGGLACLLVANYLEVQVAVLFGNGVDIATFDLGPFGALQMDALKLFVVLSLGMGLLGAVLRYYMRDWIIGASRHIETQLRDDIFHHLVRQSPAFYDRFRTGDLMSRATSDVEAVRTVVGPSVMYMANTIAMLPLSLYQMFHISVKLTLICFLPMLLIGPIFYIFKRGIHERYKRTQELMSDLSANIQENLSGVRVIKVHAREAQQAERFEKISWQYVVQNLRLAKLQSIFIPMLGLLVGMGVLALLWGGGWLILRGELTIGSLITFFVMLMGSVWPLIAFGWVLAQLERGAASMQRIEEIFDARREIEDHPGTRRDLAPVRGALELRHLTFTYPTGNQPALVDVTFSLPPGTTLGLTGPVGCGKSTLAALLDRRYNPPRGTVLLDGIDLLDWPIDELRQQIGIVDQEPFLFSDSIEANILFGVDGNIPAEKQPELARHAARVAQMEGDVTQFPQQYETLLGERGINLSGGQRQRAALARALARDPRLLILDDALAAVDTHTEEAILRGLRELLGARTTLLISHRVSTMSLADVILYLEDGRVVEMGTHEELLARRGAYWALAQRQMLSEEIEETA
jgi:ATP-binding cassette subfamily B protein